ncbi:MAG: Ig-like domain-containing protein [Bacilli bacterium]
MIGNKAGTCKIYAVADSANGEDTGVKSNEIDIVVNPLKPQDKTGAVYDLPVTGLSGENVGVANSIQNTLPLSVTAKGADFRAAGLKISDLFSGNTLILDPLRQDSHDSSVLSFDFSDQQVSSLSFYYGLYYEAHKTNENHISSILLRTSNDGENWTELDITAEVKASISSKNLKLMEKSFAPSSKVQIALTGDIVGKNYSFSLGGIAFMAGKNCHAHEEVPSTIDVTAVSISSPSATVRMGKTLAISDVVTPSNATNKALTYKSSNEEVATLDNNGILTPKKAGTCFVTATSSNSIVSNSLDITVLDAVSLDSSYLGTYKGLDDNSNPVTLLVESGKATLSFEKSGKTDSFVLTLDDYRDSA